ncbi:MAG: tetratricopeptide repeat protein [Candidatus Omnitrophica bacterium]|nr:tetratricopeptide repeat protein [Candidatus Omnitrophota bacterium]
MLKSDSKKNEILVQVLSLILFISFISYPGLIKAEVVEPRADQFRAKGYEEYKQGNLEDALYYYNKAIEKGYNKAVILNDLGVLFEESGKLKEAEASYLKALELDPKYLAVYSNLAMFYKKNGPKGKAVKYFKLRYELATQEDPWRDKVKEELIEIHPEYADWFVRLEANRLNDELVKKAQEELQAEVKEKKERSKKHFAKGESLAKEQKFEEAINEFDEALRLTPGSKEIVSAKEQAKIQIVKKVLEVKTKKAMELLSSGEMTSAKEEIQEILTAIPNEPKNNPNK